MNLPSYKQLKTYLETVEIVTDAVDGSIFIDNDYELVSYRLSHSYRLWRSMHLLTEYTSSTDTLRVLELGSAPYFFSAMMRDYFDYEVIGSNVQAGVMPQKSEDIQQFPVTLRHGFDGQMDDFPIYIFNFELDSFPFLDHEFDMVLCMEVIEHLAYNPLHMLAEAHRVLKPGGLLVVTTPNAVDMHKTIRMVRNRPIAFEYSGYGVYGRHNREYTATELAYLTKSCGYTQVHVTLENVYLNCDEGPKHHPLYNFVLRLSELPISYFKNKREYLMLTARSTGKPHLHYTRQFYLFADLYQKSSQPKLSHG